MAARRGVIFSRPQALEETRMIRRKTGLKHLALLSLLGASLVSVACSDDDDGVGVSSAGSAGSAGKSTAGSGGKANGGTSAGGSNGTAGSNAGKSGSATAGNQSAAGEASGGMAGSDATGGTGEGGSGGDPSQAGMGQGGEAAPGGNGGDGGDGGDGGEGVAFDVLDNPGFELGTDKVDIPGWTNEGSVGAAFIQHSDAHGGTGRLGHWTMWSEGAPAYTARTYQTVSPIPNGTYSFSMWVNRDWFDGQFLFAKGFNANDLDEEKTVLTEPAAAENTYLKITLSGIVVTSGSITVGVDSAAPAGTWANFDDAELTLE
jgi:hypothetical protein